MKRYCIDLFAGCGGLSLGLENAGFQPLLVNELADEARDSYLVNRKQFSHLDGSRVDDPENPWVWKDVKALRKYIENDIAGFQAKARERFSIDIAAGELDILVGGPPCQGYSGIGHRRSYAVDKKKIPSNHLYEDMIFLINSLGPKMFLFENVKGLLSAQWHSGGKNKGEIWRDVRSEFKKFLGNDYHMGWHLVRAAEYGVPQNRPRVLLVGIRKDLGWSPKADTRDKDDLLLWNDVARAGGLLPDPTGTPPSLEELLSDLIDPKYVPRETKATTTYRKNPRKSKKGEEKSIQEILRTSQDGRTVYGRGDTLTEQEYSRHSVDVVKKFAHMIEFGEIPPEYRTKKFAQRVLPKRWVDGEPTITATSLPDDYVHFDKRNPRILTVREWARLQMFPDWYRFKGNRTTGGVRRAGNPRENIFDREVPKYTQIGNAVPVRLAECVGKHFCDILDEIESAELSEQMRASA